ncbi:MAG TPA: SIS domain-containing protein [Albidovulum sp.]|uniref:SIS domain-containing protein n=1 Tax=Albidovulum sp. TaxID=1872424 RepID=UPI002BF5568E|nr:SIS domain-containing protein [Albidovulum sp.]
MTNHKSLMYQEIREIPAAVQRLLDDSGPAIREAASAARALDPSVIVTVARGSSDHACTYLKYVAELTLGLPVASVGPSVSSIYGASLRLPKALCISVSQSGKSPDIVDLAGTARAGGAMTLAITNDAASPLAKAADRVIDIAAGPERSVAATKTFVTSAVAGLALLAEWQQDRALLAAIAALPERLAQACAADWGALGAVMATESSLFTIARGPSFAMSGEAALKFKETCQVHAENYSSAEVMHGPVSIVGDGFPVLAFAAHDAAEEAVAGIADAMAGKGARVFATTNKVKAATVLPAARTDHWLTDPLALIVSFYAMVEKVAIARGINPDAPRHLRKVTETV